MALREMPQFEFIIRDAPFQWVKELILIERTDGADYWINIEKTEPNGIALLRRTKLEEGRAVTDLRPFLELQREIAVPFLQALLTALNSNMKLPRPSEDRLAGQLEAVREHLKDMRRLVFEPATERVILQPEEKPDAGN